MVVQSVFFFQKEELTTVTENLHSSLHYMQKSIMTKYIYNGALS